MVMLHFCQYHILIVCCPFKTKEAYFYGKFNKKLASMLIMFLCV